MGAATCRACGRPGLEADAAGEDPAAKDLGRGDEQLAWSTEAGGSGPSEVEPAASAWVLPVRGKLTVMMFGMTGAGKSSLGNLLADGTVFLAADDTSSVTNLDSVMRHEAADGSLVLLDTIGLGDTEVDQDKVVASIRDVALSAPLGIDVLLFVMRHSRITDDAIARLIYVTEYLWGSECMLNLYVVITHASRYVQKKDEAVAWIERQVELNWRFKHIYNLVGNNPNRFIFVDNPDPASEEPMLVERQRASREGLMRALALHPRDIVPPFRHRMMREAARLSIEELAEVERRVKEEQELGREDSDEMGSKLGDSKDGGSSSSKSPKKERSRRSSRRGSRSKDTLALAELREKREKARQAREQAEQALRKRLEEVKASAEFQAKAAKSAQQATQRFAARYEQVTEPLKTPLGGTTSPVTACRNLLGALTKRAFSLGKSRGGSKEFPPPEKAKSGGSPMARLSSEPDDAAAQQTPDLQDGQLDALLARLRLLLSGGARDTFERQTGSASATLSPVSFMTFLAAVDPNIQKHHAGGLWRRGDLNCDGQLDLTEFLSLFGSPRPNGTVKGRA